MPQSFVIKLFLLWQVLQEMVKIYREILLSVFGIVLLQSFGRKKQIWSRFAWFKWLFKLFLLSNVPVWNIAKYFATCGFEHFITFLRQLFTQLNRPVSHTSHWAYWQNSIRKFLGVCSGDSLADHFYLEVQFVAESMAQRFIVFKLCFCIHWFWIHNKELIGLVLMGGIGTIVPDPKHD